MNATRREEWLVVNDSLKGIVDMNVRVELQNVYPSLSEILNLLRFIFCQSFGRASSNVVEDGLS